MGSLSKLLVLLFIFVVPGALIAAPVIWFVQRWRRQRLLAVHSSVHV